MSSRRKFFSRAASIWTAALAGGRAFGVQQAPGPQAAASSAAASPGPGRSISVETPDIQHLPWNMVDGAKEFHLTAEVVQREFLPSQRFDVWGYNGATPGPAIEVNEGDRVRVIFENKLPEATTVHWHGLEIPMDMDGVPGVGQDPVPPGGRFIYEFTLHQHGTFFYHSHMAMQEMMGLIGLFIIHPHSAYQPEVDRDFAWVLQEWAILPNNTIPNTLSMEFNWLTMNGRAGPATTPVLVKQGERVRLRFVNMGMDHHPMHLHGNTWMVTGTEAGRIPESAWLPGNTVLVGVGEARTVEFEAKYLGDWMLHCHMPHHMMNQMVSMVGPMAHGGAGLHAGLEMQEGMGMIRRGPALSEELGPGLGRGLGVGASREQETTHFVGLSQTQAAPAQHQHVAPPSGDEHGGGPGVEQQALVPGFPQDMWMVMDTEVAKPETYGLRPTWSGALMGMMTLVRVLTPEVYDRITALKKQASLLPGAGRRPKSGSREG